MRHISIVCLWGLGLLIGCESRSKDQAIDELPVIEELSEVWSAPGSVRDSAGVRIVEHSGFPEALPRWLISSEPTLNIGSLDGSGPDVFGGIVGIAELSNGVVVIADRTVGELRAFDRSGEHQWTAGRVGQGPGEFTSLGGVLALPGDSLLAWEVFSARAFVFGPGGQYVRSVQFAEDESTQALIGSLGLRSRIMILGSLANGTLVTSPGAFAGTHPLIPPQVGKDSFLVSYHDSKGKVLHSLRKFPLTERVQIDGQLRYVQMGSSSVLGSGGSVLATGTQERFEVLLFGEDGILGTLIRVAAENRTPDRSRFEGSGPLPEFLPAYNQVKVSTEGEVWVEEYVAPYELRAPDWWVFAPDGALTARVSLPDRFVPQIIGPDHILGVWSDELGVNYARAYEIQR